MQTYIIKIESPDSKTEVVNSGVSPISIALSFASMHNATIDTLETGKTYEATQRYTGRKWKLDFTKK